MDQSRRVSGTPYFQSVIPVASSQPSNRAKETDTVRKRVRETERTASLTSDLEGNQLSSSAQQAMAQNQSTNTHMHARRKAQKKKKKKRKRSRKMATCAIFVSLASSRGDCCIAHTTSSATQHITWWSASTVVTLAVSETGHFHFQLFICFFYQLCLHILTAVFFVSFIHR